MRVGGALRDFVSSTVVKCAQGTKRGKNLLWTWRKNRFIIGFTKGGDALWETLEDDFYSSDPVDRSRYGSYLL